MTVGPDLGAMSQRVGYVGDQRAGLGVHLAALDAETSVDAMRPVAEAAVGYRDRPDAHVDAHGLGPPRKAVRPLPLTGWGGLCGYECGSPQGQFWPATGSSASICS